MHFDGKMKNNRRKIERGLGILPYGNSHAYTIGKCGEFRLCHDTGSACYGCFRHSRRVCRLYLRLLKFYDTTKSQVCSIVIKMEDCINAEDIDC